MSTSVQAWLMSAVSRLYFEEISRGLPMSTCHTEINRFTIAYRSIPVATGSLRSAFALIQSFAQVFIASQQTKCNRRFVEFVLDEWTDGWMDLFVESKSSRAATSQSQIDDTRGISVIGCKTRNSKLS